MTNIALGGNKRKVNKRLADVLEYKEEFKAAMVQEALTLPGRQQFTDKKSRSDRWNDVIVCTRFAPSMDEKEEEGHLETFITRNPCICW